MCIVYIMTVNAGYVSLLIPAMYIIPIMLYWHKAFVCVLLSSDAYGDTKLRYKPEHLLISYFKCIIETRLFDLE